MNIFKKINKWLQEFNKYVLFGRYGEYERLLNKSIKQLNESLKESLKEEQLSGIIIKDIEDNILEHEMKMNPLTELRISEFDYIYGLCESVVENTLVLNGKVMDKMDRKILMLKFKTGEEKISQYKGYPVVVDLIT